jgi:hypothetical protein
VGGGKGGGARWRGGAVLYHSQLEPPGVPMHEQQQHQELNHLAILARLCFEARCSTDPGAFDAAAEWGVFIGRGHPQLQGLAGRAHSKGLYAHPGTVAATVTHIVKAGAIAGGTRCIHTCI